MTSGQQREERIRSKSMMLGGGIRFGIPPPTGSFCLLLISWCAGHERECGVLQLLHHDAILEKGEEVKPLSYYVTHPTVPRSYKLLGKP